MKHCCIYKQTLGKRASLTPCSARITVSGSCYGLNKRNLRFRCNNRFAGLAASRYTLVCEKFSILERSESGSALDIAMLHAS